MVGSPAPAGAAGVKWCRLTVSNSRLKAPVTKIWTPKYDKLHSSLAFSFNLRWYAGVLELIRRSATCAALRHTLSPNHVWKPLLHRQGRTLTGSLGEKGKSLVPPIRVPRSASLSRRAGRKPGASSYTWKRLSQGGQGERLVPPPYTRGLVSLSISLTGARATAWRSLLIHAEASVSLTGSRFRSTLSVALM